MAFMDILNQNQQQATGAGQSFTQQATQMQQALTGKSVAPAPIQKSNIAEQTATAAAQVPVKQELAKAQTQQQGADLQAAATAQKDRENDQQYQQKRAAIVADTQRKMDALYNNVTQNYASMDEKQQAASMQQIEFYHNLSDTKYIDQVQQEGEKRRLDDSTQLKTAMMYATFDDNITLVKNSQDFQAAFNADNRTFQQYLATIRPDFAINMAVQDYQRLQAGKAAEGMSEGVGKGVSQGIQDYLSPSPAKTSKIVTPDATGE